MPPPGATGTALSTSPSVLQECSNDSNGRRRIFMQHFVHARRVGFCGLRSQQNGCILQLSMPICIQCRDCFIQVSVILVVQSTLTPLYIIRWYGQNVYCCVQRRFLCLTYQYVVVRKIPSFHALPRQYGDRECHIACYQSYEDFRSLRRGEFVTPGGNRDQLHIIQK